jgi:hypothetical protein
VTFEPGARTAWHTHPLGQTLIVTAGCGCVQREGGPIEEMHPGDVVWIPPHEKELRHLPHSLTSPSRRTKTAKPSIGWNTHRSAVPEVRELNAPERCRIRSCKARNDCRQAKSLAGRLRIKDKSLLSFVRIRPKVSNCRTVFDTLPI